MFLALPFSGSDFQTPGDRADGVSSRQTQHLLSTPPHTIYLKCEYQTYSPTTLGGSISSRKREDLCLPPVSPLRGLPLKHQLLCNIGTLFREFLSLTYKHHLSIYLTKLSL